MEIAHQQVYTLPSLCKSGSSPYTTQTVCLAWRFNEILPRQLSFGIVTRRWWVLASYQAISELATFIQMPMTSKEHTFQADQVDHNHTTNQHRRGPQADPFTFRSSGRTLRVTDNGIVSSNDLHMYPTSVILGREFKQYCLHLHQALKHLFDRVSRGHWNSFMYRINATNFLKESSM